MTIESLSLEQVTSAYSGIANKCCCGCKGKHYHRRPMGDYRGGGTPNDMRQIRRIFNIVRADSHAEFGGNQFCTTKEGRWYIVYTT